MFKIGNQGTFETLPDEAMAIYKGDVIAVEEFIKHGMDLEKEITLSKYIALTPLDIALITNQLPVIKVLVERGVNLNVKDNPAILKAVRYGGEELIRYLHQKGAKLNSLSKVKSNAYDEAYYGNKKNIAVLKDLGLDIQKYGGKTLRRAVSDHDLQTIQYLLDEGVDINYNEPDMVYPYKATPLTVAARNNNMKMVQFLVERGADVTIQEKDGERAYTIAVSQKNAEMAEYLKSHEPQDFHSLSNKLHVLKSYKLPDVLIRFLTEGPRRIDLPDNPSGVGYIEFFHLIDTVEMKLGRQKLLRISSDVDQYSHILIVWNPSKKMIGFADIEHQEIGNICTFPEFLADPGEKITEFFDQM
ncbi:ankyrin repeat domain-containing protein [Paenibacillus sp. E222]|uniref:ankyrin repeat domain-containing protein n=1 Tax=Paenibacillus sp. E222 TaxID=2748863 RepID=UPI0015C68F59|nr:ankyrin repeat domain-containing protein [Paenibacillus sp. E222]QLG39834.1 ankyrin repeat domain-containing protein [Paenibacillus sp. E222]